MISTSKNKHAIAKTRHEEIKDSIMDCGTQFTTHIFHKAGLRERKKVKAFNKIHHLNYICFKRLLIFQLNGTVSYTGAGDGGGQTRDLVPGDQGSFPKYRLQ